MCVLQSFPIYVSFIFHSFIPCFFSSILPRLFSVCSTSVFHLSSICSSIYSSFVFNSFSVCFPPSLCLFFICRHLFYAHSSFPPHSFLHSLFFSFIYHLFSIYSPSRSRFISPFSENLAILSRSQIWFVRGQGSIPFCRVINFPLEFPRSQRMDVKAKRKVFRERLCTSDLVPR